MSRLVELARARLQPETAYERLGIRETEAVDPDGRRWRRIGLPDEPGICFPPESDD